MVGAWQSGILYLACTLSALFGVTYIVKQLGARNSLVLGMSLYVAYGGCFVLALQQQSSRQEQIVWTAYSGAAIIGGIGTGFLWTAQGVYFSQAAEQHHQAALMRTTTEGGEIDNAISSASTSSSSTGLLAGIFAFWYLAEEVALRLLSTLLLEFGVLGRYFQFVYDHYHSISYSHVGSPGLFVVFFFGVHPPPLPPRG
jgi:hypothetical protein